MTDKAYTPFLDNIGTVGAAAVEKGPLTDHQKRVMRNRRRGHMHSEGAAINKRVYYQLQDFFHTPAARDMPEESLEHFCLLRTRLAECCKHALYREFYDGGDVEFIAAHTCDHKYCFVCNKLRSKTIRRKFVKFFNAYSEVRENYDFMHLTLTVPHTADGWGGEQFYASKLMKTFNLMRKKDWWQQLVYAGEFGVEITKNDNGLHIHIHSLLLVEKVTKSRNLLHRKILLHWNKATSDGRHVPPSPEVQYEIMKGNEMLTDPDCKSMTVTGATLIGLESLYVLSKDPKKGYKWCQRSGAYKRYINPTDDDDFLAGIMECIKYHFEPSGMYADEGRLDFDLLNEILPKIYRKPLYRKFGAFHSGTKAAHPGAALLNFNEKEKETIEEILGETGHEEVIHPGTGEGVMREEYGYMITRADKVFYDKQNDYRPIMNRHTERKYLHNAFTVVDALLEMLLLSNPYISIKKEQT